MAIFYQEPDHTIYRGHALDILRQMPDESVDMAITSPPYWGLRTYKTEPIIWGENHCEHEWGDTKIAKFNNVQGGECTRPHNFIMPTEKSSGNFCFKCHAWKGELGLEPTIELYIEHLILIFNEVKRVLKKTGTCWVNLDDSYYGGGFGHEKDLSAEDFAKKYPKQGSNLGTKLDWQDRKMVGDTKRGRLLPAKSLCLIPQRFAIAMVNAGWILRNDIAWNKPNPMPESVKDRFTGSWEHLFFFAKSRSYYFEQQFERYTEPLNRWGGPTLKQDTSKTAEYKDMMKIGYSSAFRVGRPIRPNELGRNKRDVWEITTEPYPEAHFATFPEKLCEIPILAGCPSMICRKCRKAREKIYEGTSQDAFNIRVRDVKEGRIKHIDRVASAIEVENYQEGITHVGEGKREIGYTDCGCNAGWEAGIVLDSFTGSGTAQAVAKRLGRKSIGIELNPDYCKLAAKRLQEIPMSMPLLVA